MRWTKIIVLYVFAIVILRPINVFSATSTIDTALTDTYTSFNSGDTVTVTGAGSITVSVDNKSGISGNDKDNVTAIIQTPTAGGGFIQVKGANDPLTAYGIELRDGADITVQESASVVNLRNGMGGSLDTDDAVIKVGSSGTISISGTVTGGGGTSSNWSPGIRTGDLADITVTATGTVTTEGHGGQTIDVGANSTITNAGQISEAYGLGGEVVKAPPGTVSSHEDLGSSTPVDNVTVINTGTISRSYRVGDTNHAAAVVLAGSSSTITNSNVIENTLATDCAIYFGLQGTGSTNVLNVYGDSDITGFLQNAGAAAGATINFGYDGTSLDSTANTSIAGNIDGGGATWNARSWGGTNTVTGSTIFNNLQTDNGSLLSLTGGANVADTLTNAGTLTADITHNTANVFTMVNTGVLTGDVTVTGGILDITNSGTITGDIASAVSAAHSFSQTAGSVTGNISLTGAASKTFSMDGGTITGNVDLGIRNVATLSAGTINGSFDVGDLPNPPPTATCDAAAGQTMTLANSGGTAFTGQAPTLKMSGAGTLVITGNMVDTGGGTDVTLDVDSGTVQFTESSAIDGDIDADGGTVDVGANTLTIKAATDFASGATFKTTVGSTTGLLSNGVSDVGITFNNNSAVSLTVPTTVLKGNSYTVVNATGAGGAANLTATAANMGIDDDSVRYDFLLSKVNDTLVVTSSLGDVPGLSGNAGAVNNVVDDAFGGDGQMMSAINGIDSASELNNDLITLTPVDNSPVALSSVTLQNDSLSTVENRILAWREGTKSVGMNSGDIVKGVGIWGQGFYTYSDQDNKNDNFGYRANNAGFALGSDMQFLFLDMNTLLGFAYSMGWANVDVNDLDNRTNIANYLFGLYTSIKKNNFFIDIKSSYSLNDYDDKRYITVGSVERKATSDFFGHQFSVDGDIGYVFDFKYFKVRPTTGLQYTMLHTGSYTEEGAGDANLKVDSNTYNQLNWKTGLGVATEMDGYGFTWVPEAFTEFIYETLNEGLNTSSTFAGGGTSFAIDGLKPDRYIMRFGGALSAGKGEGFEVGLRYTFDMNETFRSHNAILEVRYDF